MKKNLQKKVSLACLISLLVLLAGCCVNIGSCGATAKYKRQVQLTSAISPGSTFEAHTHNGFINITGADVTNCDVTATITARALTEETAKELAEQTQISLEPSSNRLIAKVDKPTLSPCQSINISFSVTVPSQTSLELTTHNGAIKIENINGKLNCTTHNGKVTARQVTGSSALRTHNGAITIENINGQLNCITHNGKVTAREVTGSSTLRSHNGSIICEEISGDAQLKTHNGSIKAYYGKDAPAVCDISIETHNGGIEFSTPPNLSANIEVSTHNGSIHTDLPIQIIGKINKHKLTGTIGTGEGNLHLETHNGSIKIR